MAKKEKPRALFIILYYCSSVGAHGYGSIRVMVGDSDMSTVVRVPSTLAKPKSRTFTVPLGVSLVFAGFRSRCTVSAHERNPRSRLAI